MAYKRLFPSMENVKHQSNDFFIELSETIRALREENPRVERWGNQQEKSIAKVIHKYTNSNVSVEFNENYDSFYNEEFVSVFEKHLKDGTEFFWSGGVDYANGKLIGDFAKLKTKIFLTYQLLSSKFTPEETAAIILHETGHLVTMLDLLGKAFITNFALKEIADSHGPESTVEKRKIILASSTKKLGLNKLDVESLSKMDSPEVVSLIVLEELRDSFRSQLGCDIYDTTATEFLADQYAIKMGAGKHMLTALDKYVGRGIQNPTVFYSLELMKVLTFTGVGVAAILSSPVLAGFASVIISPWIAAFGYLKSDFLTNKKHDDIETRFFRLRMMIIQRLKDPKLPDDLKKQARSDLTYIDDVIKITKDRKTMFFKLMEFLSPRLRKRMKEQQIQMELEKLAFNDLFIKAYDLKNIIK